MITTAFIWDVTLSSLVDMIVQAAGFSKTLALHVYLPDMTALHSIRLIVFNTVIVTVEPPSSAPRIPRRNVQYGIPHFELVLILATSLRKIHEVYHLLCSSIVHVNGLQEIFMSKFSMYSLISTLVTHV